MRKERYYTLDLLRLLACLNVVICHTAGSPIVKGSVVPGSWDYSICVMLEALTRWDIAIFVMLPGFFLLNPEKNLPIKTVITKYVMRVVGALTFWSLFYAVTLHAPFYPLGVQEGHFWYLCMIIGVYLSFPILRLIARNAQVMRYFIFLWMGYLVYGFLNDRTIMPIKPYPMVFADFVGFALYAYYLKTVFVKPENPRRVRALSHFIYLAGIVGLIVGAAVPVMSQNDNHFVMSFTSPNTIAFVTAIFVFCIRHPLRLNEKMGRFVSVCSQCTFGVYLVHIWILIQIFNRLSRFIPSQIVVVGISVIVAYVTGLIMSYFLRKIPFCRKYIV